MPQVPTAVLGVSRRGSDYPRPFGTLMLLKALGRDERAEVFIGLRPDGVDRVCIVKLLRAPALEAPGARAALRAQAGWLVARVQGNLVQIYDVGEVDDRVFFVNEFVEGRDMGAVLKSASSGLPPEVAVYAAQEIAGALGYIRKNEEKATGVRTSLLGLSAADVLVSRDGVFKLLHHGSCLAPANVESAARNAAAASMISPALAAGNADARADVFFVGALLWQMLSGKALADEAQTHVEALRAGRFTPPALPAGDRPAALDQLVAAALAPLSDDRPTDCDLLVDELGRVLKALGRDGAESARGMMAERFGAELETEAQQVARLAAMADREAARLGPRTPSRTLTNFEDTGRPSPSLPRKEAELRPGAVIPGTRYRTLEKLGEGGMGAVYAAEHVDIERKVALKLVHSELLRNPVVLRQFRQEARAASRIGNPYICDVTDWGELPDGRVFFVMEFLDGPSLGRVLKERRRLPPSRCIPVLRQVAKALGAAHEKGIVHLDVKPDNVLLLHRFGRHDAVKVVDFGVAGILGQASGNMKVMGTPEYMAPERATGKGYDHRSDIYSLGVMAYEMIVGEVPLQGTTPLETLAMQASEPPDAISERLTRPVPQALEAAVMRMLEKAPEHRPQSMAEVEALLCEAQIDARIRTPWDDLPLPSVDPERAARLSRRMSTHLRRLRLSLAVVASVAVLSAGTSTYFAVRGPVRSDLASLPPLPPKPVVTGPAFERLPAPAPPPPPAPAAAPAMAGESAESGEGARSGSPSRRRRDEQSSTTGARDPVISREAAGRGRAALAAGRFVQAKTEFDLAVLADSNNADAVGGLAEVLFEQARYHDAVYYAQRAVRLASRSARNHTILGDVYAKLGRYPEAQKAYQRAAALAPDDADIKASLERVNERLGGGG